GVGSGTRMKFNLKTGFDFASILMLFLAAPASQARAEPFEFKVVWTAGAGQTTLKSWPVAEISKLKSQSVGDWKGVTFSQWIDKALADVPLEKRAQVDLIVLTSATGGTAIIPRFVAKKFPILLAYEKGRQSAPLATVVPDSARKRMESDGL